MTIEPRAQTLTRVSTFYGDLGEAVKKYSSEARPVRSVLGNTTQYGLYQETPNPHVLMVSRQIDEVLTKYGYNFIITVTSEFEDTNNQVTERFQETTGIDLRKAPEGLSRHFDFLNNILPIFKKNGMAAMAVLGGGI